MGGWKQEKRLRWLSPLAGLPSVPPAFAWSCSCRVQWFPCAPAEAGANGRRPRTCASLTASHYGLDTAISGPPCSSNNKMQMQMQQQTTSFHFHLITQYIYTRRVPGPSPNSFQKPGVLVISGVSTTQCSMCRVLVTARLVYTAPRSCVERIVYTGRIPAPCDMWTRHWLRPSKSSDAWLYCGGAYQETLDISWFVLLLPESDCYTAAATSMVVHGSAGRPADP